MYVEDVYGSTEDAWQQESLPYIILEIIEYTPGLVVIRTVIKKNRTSVCLMSFDSRGSLMEKVLPFDTFIQVVEGSVQISVNKVTTLLERGHGMVIPANSPSCLIPEYRFKMIVTTIKGTMED